MGAVLNQTFKFLPQSRKNLTKELLLTEIKQNINNTKTNIEIKIEQLKLCSIIIDKLTSDEWNIEDYCNFYQSINQRIIEEFSEYALPALIKLFDYSDKELKEDLDKISEQTKNTENQLYPYRKLVLTEDKRQVPVEIPYSKTDPYHMVVELLPRFSRLQTDTTKLLFSAKTHDVTLEMLDEIIKGEREDITFVKEFEQNFGYLAEIEAYRDLYLNYKNDYIKIIRKHFKNMCQQEYNSKLKVEVNYYHERGAMLRYNKDRHSSNAYQSIKKKTQ